MQIFVRSSSTHVLCVSPADTVGALKARVENAVGIPAGIQRLIFGGRQLLDELSLRDSSVEADATLHLVLRLRGGKGGFGALLRGAGRAAQSDNQDAMRDLSGRRLRHVNADKKLQEWAAEARRREAEEAERKQIRELERQVKREARLQVNLEDVHAQQAAALASVADALQAGLAGGVKRAQEQTLIPKPPAPKRARLPLPLDDAAALSSGSDSDEEYDDGAGGLTGSAAFQPQRPAPSGLSDSCVAVIGQHGGGGGSSSSGSEQQALVVPAARVILAEVASTAGTGFPNPDPVSRLLEQQASIPPSRAANGATTTLAAKLAAGVTEAATCSPSMMSALRGADIPMENPKAYPEVDLARYSGPEGLEALGLEALKAELTRRGLKCGGALQERAARLWLLRHTPREALDRKHLAKASK